MTLTLVALAAIVSVGLSRAAVQRIVVARQTVEDLQHRWGVISSRNAVLPHAELVLTAEEKTQSSGKKRGMVISVTRSVTLGNQDFKITVGDEQAKPNVNMLLRELGEKNAEQAIRKRLSGTGMHNVVNLLVSEANPWPIGSYGQMFRDVTPEKLTTPLRTQAGGKEQAVRDMLTCWGSGRINLMRADVKAINLILNPDVPAAQVQRMIIDRDKSESYGLGDALQSLQVSSEAQAKVMQKLTAQSKCHSMWITTSTGRRTWHHIIVKHEGAEPQLTRYHSVVW